MNSLQKSLLLCVTGALIVGVGCRKPATTQPAKVEKASTTTDSDAEARRRAEEEARRKAEEAQLNAEAARKAEADKSATEAFQKAAEKALQDVHFNYDKSSILDADKPVLEGIAAFLKPHAQAKLQIEGHCDERGTLEYNLALGSKRAKAAADYLKTLGVDESRLSIISYGKEKPVCTESAETCWSKNRRAHFILK